MHRAPVLEWLLAAFLRVAGPVRNNRRKPLYGDAQVHRYSDFVQRRDPQPVGGIPGMGCFDRCSGKDAEHYRRRPLKKVWLPVSMRAAL
ncbi:hypothetical protein [Burkholderia aenigmatica]|uniref:hypothetical protein n=1 Tax=Burkholderia aenigmatica TaxID=2015348 RepID=UPI001177BA4A|nr:hypothetical protein [Burkholderia aenigmatica]